MDNKDVIIHIIEFYSSVKNEVMKISGKQMELENITMS